jgi:hypothetical protein
VVAFRTPDQLSSVVTIAMAAPATLVTQDQVKAFLPKKRVEAYLSSDEAIQRAIGRAYGSDRSAPVARVAPRATATVAEGAEGAESLFFGSSLGLSDKCRDTLERAARDSNYKPRDIIVAVLERWATEYPK